MADLTREDILKVARLSKLELTEEQITQYQKEIQAIVEYVEHLRAADVKGLEPTNQVSGLTNATRSDEVREFASAVDLLKNLPDQENGQIKVKRMIG